eukprot:45811-Eustigmatos_ZCMA.PRE.1
MKPSQHCAGPLNSHQDYDNGQSITKTPTSPLQCLISSERVTARAASHVLVTCFHFCDEHGMIMVVQVVVNA